MKQRILAIPDCHHPYASRVGMRKLYEIAKAFDPTIIVQLGDLFDCYSFSRFPRTLSTSSPKQEMEQAYADANAMWLTLKTIAPKAKKYQLKGNHDERIIKKILAQLPEIESLIPWEDIFGFKGVQTIEKERDELIIEDIIFHHGYRSKLGDHARHNGMSTVVGHSHRGGVVFLRLGDRVIWELNGGHLADESAGALSYTRQRLVSTWTMGVGLIDHLGPRFVPI